MLHHSINKALAIACLLSIFLLTFIASAHRQDFRVMEAMLTADDARMSGPCPIKVVFNGYIKTNGPGTVKYTFTRSDGATAPVLTMDFKEAGRQPVSTDWTLGDARLLPHFEGWQTIRILSPNDYESNKAKFEIDCKAGKEKQPDAQPAGGRQDKEAVTTQQPGEIQKISPAVLAEFRRAERDSDARADVRKKAFEADRNRFEPTATALAEALKAAGVDLDGYLAASKQFVETSPGKRNQSDVELTNEKFAEPIRAAIAKAVGVSGVGDLLQGMQSGQPAPGGPAPVQPNQGSGSGNGNCGAGPGCSTNRFEPPFEGLYSEADIGARSIRPFGETRQLYSRVRGLVIGAPHNLEASGRSFTVPATARRVSVTVNLGTKWTIGLSGIGYAHVWLGLDMRLTDGRAVAVVCSAPHLEQDNQWTWVGGRLTLVEHAPTSITRTCSFDRNAGDPTDYAVTVGASVDGTFVGFSGGYGDYYVDLGTVEVTTCP